MVPQVQIIGITGIPEVTEGDDLAALILSAAQAQGTTLEAGDVLVVTQKVVSKAEGAVVDLKDVTPSPLALEFAREHNKDPRHVEVVLRESRRIVRMERGVLIAESKHGFICANAGVDASNIPGEERVSLLPRDPDGSARRLREVIMARLGFPVAVIISDSFGRPWRLGSTDVAIGIAGISPLKDYRGVTDPYGYLLRTSTAAVADEIASAAELVTGKVDLVPVSIARGFPYLPDEEATAKGLLREASLDMFR
ncbi:MAG: coenzyme gamma-glutamyl ligase [Dehalococcoidia bacterium]|nr:coenzyme gamma-glutamyl ligase [Dehalococcoidia bacterium]